MPGPPKTPTYLALVKGNPSKRTLNKNEPKPPSGASPTKTTTSSRTNPHPKTKLTAPLRCSLPKAGYW